MLEQEITVYECLNQSPCGERLLAKIIEELSNIFEENSNSKVDADKIEIILDLGLDLLKKNYYDKSDTMMDEFCKDLGVAQELLKEIIDNKTGKYGEVLKQQELDRKEKLKDYRKFFKLLGDNLESWC